MDTTQKYKYTLYGKYYMNQLRIVCQKKPTTMAYVSEKYLINWRDGKNEIKGTQRR